MMALVFFAALNACNQEETDLVENQVNIENDMIALSSSIRYTTRINVASSGRLAENGTINLEQLEGELIAYHENNGYEGFENDYDSFLTNESTN